MEPKRIIFAVGHKGFENKVSTALAEKYPNEYEVVGIAAHKEAIVDLLKEKGKIDILIVYEGLKGSLKADIFKIVIDIKTHFPDIRIIFIANKRTPGDINLAKLVLYNIYDIYVGESIKIDDMLDFIVKPREFKDVLHFVPNMDTNLFSEEELRSMKESTEKKEEIKEKDIVKKVEVITETVKEVIKKKSETEPVVQQKQIPEPKQEEKPSPPPVQEPKPEEVQPENPGLQKLSQEETEEIKELLEKAAQKHDMGRRDSDYDYIYDDTPGQPRHEQTRAVRQKVVSFYGAKSGVGTTVVALNTAVELANMGYRVIYIEMNPMTPCFPYWYDLFITENGLDYALTAVETNNLHAIEDNIITKDKMLRMKSDVIDNYHKFPGKLEYLFFSDSYIRRVEKPGISMNSFKDLLFFMMYQKGYDFIILDLCSFGDPSLTENLLMFSQVNCIVITQDVATIGYWLRFSSKFLNQGISFNNNFMSNNNSKTIYIANRYFKDSKLDKSHLIDWLKNPQLICVPENTKEINDSTLRGLPTMLVSKNKVFKEAIKEIANRLLL